MDEYLQPNLQGFALVKGHYQALPLSAEGELISRELGLILRPQGDLLRLVDSYTGQILANSKEYARQVELAEQQAHVETQRADLAEAKVIELQQELEKLRWKRS